MRLTWAQPEDLVPHEFVALREEGVDTTEFEKVWVDAGGSLIPEVSGASAVAAPAERRVIARKILHALQEVESPARTEAIYAPYRAAAMREPRPIGRADYERRVAGAWHGRLVGCLLGKPVEKIPRQGVEEIARATGNWPISSYFTAKGLPEEISVRWPWNRRSRPTSLKENINGMPEDDDINYPLLALSLLEEKGSDFTSDDVVNLWLANLSAGRVFTAERAAYRNILDARPVPESAIYINPFREWIGALIRADVFGWVNPGNEAKAAEMAWRDARVSHTRNGVYGEMWAAALTSSAMTADSAEEAIERSLTVIPPTSLLAQAVRSGEQIGRDAGTLREGLDRLHADFGHYHWVHVLNNAATISFALTVGKGDFTASIGAAVSAGWDTDSVGATVGSVAGALGGTAKIDRAWTDPIHGFLRTSLPGMNEIHVSEVISRTIDLGERISHV
ncbi:ADP-ribosylglycohydrolase family protein [Trueperella sp. LYQ141]|uniref:ADP-ribosylglycohydrolase family protein n=1 Tax=Trueperella sp. LYQ141 TaxID=3391058 RepID=UPI0039833800